MIMKNNKINTLCISFLAWILATGTIYDRFQCRDQENPSCYRNLILEPASEVFYSSGHTNEIFCTEDAHNLSCMDLLCRPQGSLLTGFSIATNIGIDRSGYLLQIFTDKNQVSNPFFVRYQKNRRVPIYTIVQSFLC